MLPYQHVHVHQSIGKIDVGVFLRFHSEHHIALISLKFVTSSDVPTL